MNPRGSIVLPSRAVNIGGGTFMGGRKPGIIVYVKANSGRLMRKFARHCAANGIHAFPVQEVGNDGSADAWECLGTVDSLERLTSHRAVRDWHLIVNVRPPLAAAGSGEIGPNAERAARRARMRWPDREALEETERRARLPKDECERIELEELLARERALAT